MDLGLDLYWVKHYIPRRFRDVFDERNRPKRERKGQEWLSQLPGGFTDSLDFLQLLNFSGGQAFVKQGFWTSRFGFVSSKV